MSVKGKKKKKSSGENNYHWQATELSAAKINMRALAPNTHAWTFHAYIRAHTRQGSLTSCNNKEKNVVARSLTKFGISPRRNQVWIRRGGIWPLEPTWGKRDTCLDIPSVFLHTSLKHSLHNKTIFMCFLTFNSCSNNLSIHFFHLLTLFPDAGIWCPVNGTLRQRLVACQSQDTFTPTLALFQRGNRTSTVCGQIWRAYH